MWFSVKVWVYTCVSLQAKLCNVFGFFLFNLLFMEGERRKTRRGSSDVEVGVTLLKGMHCVIKGVSPFTDFIILEPKSWSTERNYGRKLLVLYCLC